MWRTLITKCVYINIVCVCVCVFWCRFFSQAFEMHAPRANQRKKRRSKNPILLSIVSTGEARKRVRNTAGPAVGLTLLLLSRTPFSTLPLRRQAVGEKKMTVSVSPSLLLCVHALWNDSKSQPLCPCYCLPDKPPAASSQP